MPWILKRPSATKADKAVGSTNNIKGTKEQKESKMNTNVILTEFETSILNKIKSYDEDWVLIRDFTKEDIYGKTLHESVNAEWTQVHNSFLSLRWRFINWAGTALNVTIVVVDDRRFYMSLGNQEIKEATGKDLFVNHLAHMQEIYASMTINSLTPEQIEEEANAINSFA